MRGLLDLGIDNCIYVAWPVHLKRYQYLTIVAREQSHPKANLE